MKWLALVALVIMLVQLTIEAVFLIGDMRSLDQEAADVMAWEGIKLVCLTVFALWLAHSFGVA